MASTNQTPLQPQADISPAAGEAPPTSTMTESTTSAPNQNPTTSSPPLGNLVRLVPLSLSEIPAHPSIPDSTTGQKPPLAKFIIAVLNEAVSFSDHSVPSKFTSSGTKSSQPSTSKVEILKHTIPSSELAKIPWNSSSSTNSDTDTGTETVAIPRPASSPSGVEENWFVRSSAHENKKAAGTAVWEEFDEGLRVDHNEKEAAYTPELFDANKVLDWDGETAGMELEGRFSGVQMRIYEMCHKLPFPLTTRTFPVLVVSALTGKREAIVVHMPLDISSLPAAFYSNGRNMKEGDSEIKRKKAVLGVYTSIERIRVVPEKTDGKEEVQWSMAVASDASGALPMWAQKIGLPGAIAKDVGLFLKWIDGKR
ncbi:hypothetical protein MMC25_001501 [Agyrium rufum]|nr:hypothetical protein [Agyrium rufum]